jgi:ABC-type multidrug transport system fused ATPase/permease subunit
VKGPVIELLPSGIQCRLQDKLEPLPFRGWKQFGLIVLWICVGIATHLVWDQFTHSYSWLPSQWTWLTSVSVPFLHPMPLTKILQHVSTVLGLAILFVWLLAWYRRTPPLPIADSREFPGLVKVAIVFSMGALALLIGYPLAIFQSMDRPLSWLTMIATIFVAVTFVFSTELLVYGLAFRLATRSRRFPAPELDETPR